VRIGADAARARLAVIDDGPGIPEGERQRAGERFFRASNASAPGSGIGLAIVRSIAERHGGSLDVGGGDGGRGLAAAILLPLAPSSSHPGVNP
jgi:two-component system, OmpR family, sensor histidine kinase TctE